MGFEKGKSGNPKGRPKKGDSWAEVYGGYFNIPWTKAAVEKIKHIVKNSKDDAIVLKAISMVWDRLYGRPKESLDARLTGDMEYKINIIDYSSKVKEKR